MKTQMWHTKVTIVPIIARCVAVMPKATMGNLKKLCFRKKKGKTMLESVVFGTI